MDGPFDAAHGANEMGGGMPRIPLHQALPHTHTSHALIPSQRCRFHSVSDRHWTKRPQMLISGCSSAAEHIWNTCGPQWSLHGFNTQPLTHVCTHSKRQTVAFLSVDFKTKFKKNWLNWLDIITAAPHSVTMTTNFSPGKLIGWTWRFTQAARTQRMECLLYCLISIVVKAKSHPKIQHTHTHTPKHTTGLQL